MLALVAPSSAKAAGLFTLDVVRSNCGGTINSARSDIEWNSWGDTASDPWFVETRVLALNGSDSVQTGIAFVSKTSIVDGCTFKSSTDPDYWRWTSSTDNCNYTSDSTGDFYVERASTSSNHWVMLIHGTVVQTSGSLFSAPTDIYAGGKASRTDLGGDCSGGGGGG